MTLLHGENVQDKDQAGPSLSLPGHWPKVLSTAHTHLCLLNPVRRVAPQGQGLPLCFYAQGPLTDETLKNVSLSRFSCPGTDSAGGWEAGEIFKLTLLLTALASHGRTSF